MRWRGLASVVLGLAAAPAAATGAEIVSVIQGDLLLAQIGDRKLLLEVAGVWVPAPGGLAKVAQYRGDEARQLAVDTLASGEVKVDFLPARSSEGLHQIRVRIGSESPRDLAVVLAEAGLAMSDGQVQGAPDLGAAITAAERQARRARRGLHDGGFQAHEMARSSLVDAPHRERLRARDGDLGAAERLRSPLQSGERHPRLGEQHGPAAGQLGDRTIARSALDPGEAGVDSHAPLARSGSRGILRPAVGAPWWRAGASARVEEGAGAQLDPGAAQAHARALDGGPRDLDAGDGTDRHGGPLLRGRRV